MSVVTLAILSLSSAVTSVVVKKRLNALHNKEVEYHNNIVDIDEYKKSKSDEDKKQ